MSIKNNDNTNPRRVIVETAIVSRSTDIVLDLFENALCPKVKKNIPFS